MPPTMVESLRKEVEGNTSPVLLEWQMIRDNLALKAQINAYEGGEPMLHRARLSLM